jgi:hypothetical protein
MLPFVFVNALHLNVKKGFRRGDNNAGAFSDERREPSLVSELHVAPLLLKFWIVGESFEFSKAVQVPQPAIADALSDKLREAGIANGHEATGGDSVCYITKFLGPEFAKITKDRLLEQL